jgi:K+ transporter
MLNIVQGKMPASVAAKTEIPMKPPADSEQPSSRECPMNGVAAIPSQGKTIKLALAALGVVYGDIGTSPLYAVRECFSGPHAITLNLVALFFLQKRGTAGIGKIFGPVMIFWFLTIGAAGLLEVLRNPRILAGIDPRYAWNFFTANHLHGVVVLGSVVLCISGGEALYADLGHFGRWAIKLSWLSLAFPALLLNYFGQCALLLNHPGANQNPFYGLVPIELLYPMVALATTATVIASQALISGAFSLTQQAIQLGFSPRIQIVHTSAEVKGQIYIPAVNYTLMIAGLLLVVSFRESGRLAGAYGLAVTATMSLTSGLYLVAAIYAWRWVPKIEDDQRVNLQDLGQGFYRLAARFGYLETPHIPRIMKLAAKTGMPVDPIKMSFYLGRETLLTTGTSQMMRWRKNLFALMSRNSTNPTTFFGIPPNRVVELGAQVKL